MDVEIRRLLAQINGRPKRITSVEFSKLWDPAISGRTAALKMGDLVKSPPAGFEVIEDEGRLVTLIIRRVHQ